MKERHVPCPSLGDDWQELDDEFMVVWDGYPVPQSASGQSLMCRE